VTPPIMPACGNLRNTILSFDFSSRPNYARFRTETRREVMQIRFLFVFTAALLLVVTGASAGPKEDVAAATMKWGETLGQN
jgi:hypothetical protein